MNTVDKVFVNTYERNVRHIAQQSRSKLVDHVVVRNPGHSEAHNWEKIGKVEARTKSTRLQPTPVQDTPWSRRISVPSVADTGDSTEQEDITRMLIDPNSNITIEQGNAMRRAKDDTIIAAATADALDGDGNLNPFPATQNVFGGGTAYSQPMSFDIVTEVTERFLQNDIDPDTPKVFVIGPTQVRKLLQTLEATSRDYTLATVLQSKGYIDNWMGYSWICSTRLLHPTAPGDDIDCLVMTKRAIGMMMNRDITTKVAEDPSFSFAWRIYTYGEWGAVRVEDEHIVRVQLADTL